MHRAAAAPPWQPQLRAALCPLSLLRSKCSLWYQVSGSSCVLLIADSLLALTETPLLLFSLLGLLIVERLSFALFLCRHQPSGLDRGGG